MNLETHYYNLPLRVFVLISLSFIMSCFYWRWLNRLGEDSFLDHIQTIYALQFVFWFMFLSDLLTKFLPASFFGYFVFEFMILGVIFITLTFLSWNFFKKLKFYWHLLLSTLPLFALFLFALGAT